MMSRLKKKKKKEKRRRKMEFKLEIKDHSDEVLKALKENVGLGLEAIGVDAQGHAVRDCPVDTGRLRNSITYAINGKQGQANTEPKDLANPEDYEVLAEPEDNTVYIGTNVEYAAVQEYGDTIRHTSGKAHYLRDAIATHNDQYKEILKAALEDKSI